MVKACILVRVIPKQAGKVIEGIREVEGVKEAMMVYGRFDVAVLLEVEKTEEVLEAAKKINSIEGIRRTETLLEV